VPVRLRVRKPFDRIFPADGIAAGETVGMKCPERRPERRGITGAGSHHVGVEDIRHDLKHRAVAGRAAGRMDHRDAR